MNYKEKFKISKDEAKQYQEILDLGEELSETLNIHEGVYETFTLNFPDGKFIDIHLAVGQVNAYVDGVLYDEEGYELSSIDPNYTIVGEYYFDHNGCSYTANIITE